MERTGVLINKLQQLYAQNAPMEQMLQVAQLLIAELSLSQQQPVPERKKIAVMMPAGILGGAVGATGYERLPKEASSAYPEKSWPSANAEEEEYDGKESDMKNGHKELQTLNVFEEVPTLAHQPRNKEINEVIAIPEKSLNEKLFEPRTELAEKLKDEPLKDIKKAVGVNDRFIFISELFRGDEDMYERSIKTINRFTIYPEAEFWIQRELKLKLGWDEGNPVVKQFDQLVRRRFL